MARPRIYSEAILQRAAALRRQGLTFVEVGAALRMPASTVSSALRRRFRFGRSGHPEWHDMRVQKSPTEEDLAVRRQTNRQIEAWDRARAAALAECAK